MNNRTIEKLNLRYPHFNHTIFTCGDKEQFEQRRDKNNYDSNDNYIGVNPEKNIFFENMDYTTFDWEGYSNLTSNSVENTFDYLYNKFKKSIFVKIVNGKLKVFLPFSKVKYINEWGDKIKTDPTKYSGLVNFLSHIYSMEGRKFNPKSVNAFTQQWYANNYLVRYEYPIKEHDNNIGTFKEMIDELCNNRQIPDIEFFLNRRDFPLLAKDGTEPYTSIWGDNHPLVSHKYEKYSPILSMSVTDNFADILMPTWDDWLRVSKEKEDKEDKEDKTNNSLSDWDSKKPTAIFRGSTTGEGVTIETNIRLKASHISYLHNLEIKDGEIPLLDAGITKWTLRPRKLKDDMYLQTVEKDSPPINNLKTASFLSPKEQEEYKYILYLDGHVSAFRLSSQLLSGSTVLIPSSKWKMWYSHLLSQYTHYVPVKEDLSDLLQVIQWCRENDSKCKKIAENAKEFGLRFLSKEGMFDYLEITFQSLKEKTGSYIYPEKDLNIKKELRMIKKDKKDKNQQYTYKKGSEMVVPPYLDRSIQFLEGIRLALNSMCNEFQTVSEKKNELFKNKLGVVNIHELFGFKFAVKTTDDIIKRNEHIHEAFIGTRGINYLDSPNFAHIFGYYENKVNNINTYSVITEYIDGEVMLSFLKKETFSSFILLLLQICLALDKAQTECEFVHTDLTPWNIMVKKTKRVYTPYYFTRHNGTDKFIRIETNVVPVIIDYGKSQFTYNNKKHDYTPTNGSRIQDLISLIFTSTPILLKNNLSKTDFSNLLILFNFISNTKYRTQPFTSIRDIQDFLLVHSSYENLIYEDRYDLDLKTSLDLFFYIKKNVKIEINVDIQKKFKNKLRPCLQAKSVRDYIFSTNPECKSDACIKIFYKFKNKTLATSTDELYFRFLAYGTIVLLQENILYVEKLKKKKLISKDYLDFVKGIVSCVENKYMDLSKNIASVHIPHLKPRLEKKIIDFVNKYNRCSKNNLLF